MSGYGSLITDCLFYTCFFFAFSILPLLMLMFFVSNIGFEEGGGPLCCCEGIGFTISKRRPTRKLHLPPESRSLGKQPPP